MSNAHDYRNKSAEFARLASEATSLKDITEFRRRAQAYRNLAENEEWVTANRDKIVSNRTPADGRIGHAVSDHSRHRDGMRGPLPTIDAAAKA